MPDRRLAGARDGGSVLFLTAMMLLSSVTTDLVADMWQLLSQNFGVIPHRLWWDNESGIGRRGRLMDPVTALTGTVAATLIQLEPYDPKSNGIVERANQYLETPFMPCRTFHSPGDFKTPLAE